MGKCLIFTLCLLFSTPFHAFGQEIGSGAASVLAGYIRMGLEGNLALRQKDFVYMQSLQRLKSARGMLLPSLDFNTRYSRTEGGRAEEIPVGDLLNPIHGSLNQLLGGNRFRTDLPNEPVDFFRNKEQETWLRLTQQVYNARILNTYRLNRAEADGVGEELQVLRREMVKEIKVAYFNYFKTGRIAEQYGQTLSLLREQRRVTQKLFEAHKVTRDAIHRTDTEYHRVEQQRRMAENQSRTARSRFNFLLGRPLDAPILQDDLLNRVARPALDLPSLKRKALDNREELSRLRAAIRTAGYGEKITRSNFLPNFLIVADYGFEGESPTNSTPKTISGGFPACCGGICSTAWATGRNWPRPAWRSGNSRRPWKRWNAGLRCR